MRRLSIATIVVCLSLAPVPAALAQVPHVGSARPPAPVRRPARISVELRDGSRLTGEVVASRPDRLVLRNGMGQDVVVRRRDIVSVRREDQSQSTPAGAPGRQTAASRLSFLHPSVPLPAGGSAGTGLPTGGFLSIAGTTAEHQFSLDVLPIFLPARNGLHVGFLASAMYRGRRGDGVSGEVGVAHLELFDQGRVGLLYGGASRTGPRGQVAAGLFVPYLHAGSTGGSLWMITASGRRVLSRRLVLATNALVQRRVAASVATVGLMGEHTVIRAGVALRLDHGRLGVAPVLNLGLRF
jgi:hypothetical protein